MTKNSNLDDLKKSVDRLTKNCVAALCGVDSCAGAHLANLELSITYARLAVQYYDNLQRAKMLISAVELENSVEE